MKFAGVVCLCVLFAILPGALPAQQGKLIVEYPVSKELKRSAHRLRISEAQLRNARQALQEATDLAVRIEPLPVPEFHSLGQAWVRLHRSKAAAAIEDLLGVLAVSAGNADDVGQYLNCSAASEMLLSAMADLDLEKALLLARRWPKPSADLGVDAERMSDSIVNRLRNNLLERLIYRDPERALDLLEDSGPADASTYQVRASLAQQLITTGHREEGQRILQDIISDFGRRPPDPSSLANYTSFLQQLSYIDPERFPGAFEQFLRAAGNLQAAPSGSGYALALGEEVINITYEESVLLSLLRNMTGRPEMMLRTLGSFPSLKSKLDRLGGIDSFIQPPAAPGRAVALIRSTSHNMTSYRLGGPPPSRSGSPENNRNPVEDLQSIYRELRGKALKNPSLVRQSLSELAKSPENLGLLINLASISNYEDPDLSSLALEYAQPLISQVQPLAKRASALQQFMNVARQCEGEVDVRVLKEGFLVTDLMREQEDQQAPEETRCRMSTPADYLEYAIIAEFARDDFSAAMRYVRSLPERKRLPALMRIVQALQQSF